MKTRDDVLDALKKGDRNKAFDICMNIIGFHQFLSRCGLSILEPYIPHKIYIYDELIACKTREGMRVYLSINLDWIRQELTVEIDNILKEVTSIPLEPNEKLFYPSKGYNQQSEVE